MSFCFFEATYKQTRKDSVAQWKSCSVGHEDSDFLLSFLCPVHTLPSLPRPARALGEWARFYRASGALRVVSISVTDLLRHLLSSRLSGGEAWGHSSLTSKMRQLETQRLFLRRRFYATMGVSC